MYVTNTRAVSINGKNACPAKTFRISNGQVEKTLGDMNVGYTAQTVKFSSMGEFRDYLNSLEPEDCNLYGLKDGATAKNPYMIVSSGLHADLEETSNTITRTRSNFKFAKAPGIMFVDFDEIDGSWQDSLNILLNTFPTLKHCQYVVQPSSSSNIVLPDGSPYTDTKGIHVYFAIEDASRIAEIGKIVFDRLILTGHGHIKVSKSGGMLKRTIIDSSVWQPERIDFAGGAFLQDGLTSNRQATLHNENKALYIDMDDFRPLTDKETKRLEQIWASLTKEAKSKSDQAIRHWVDAASLPKIRNARQTMARSRDGSGPILIQPGFLLITDTGIEFDIAEVISDIEEDLVSARQKWNINICDPDTEEKGKARLYVNADGTIRIHSFKHGGKVFEVMKCPIIESKNRVKDAEAIAEVMRECGVFYRIKDSVVRVNEKGSFDYYLAEIPSTHSHFVMATQHKYFVLQNSRGDHLSEETVKYAMIRALDILPDIKRLSRIPAMDDQFNIFGTRKGFDAESGYYFLKDIDVSSQSITSKMEADIAIEYLLSPFSEYDLQYPKDGRAALLAAVLTMALRPMLETASGVVVHTPRGGQSTGKTPLTNALIAISGFEFDTKSWKPGPEANKVLHSHLLQSAHKALRFDNIGEDTRFSSDALAVILTEPTYTDRLLGTNKDVAVATNVPVLISCNNYNPSKDLAVRMLEIALKPGSKNPGWLPIQKVDHVHFVATAFALIEFAAKNFDLNTIRRGLPEAKFDHWSRIVQAPVMALLDVDPLKKSYDRGRDSDADESYEIVALLNAVWNMHRHTPDELLTSRDFEDGNEKEVDALTRKSGNRSFGKILSSYARKLGECVGGDYAGYLLEKVADNSSGSALVKYRLTRLQDRQTMGTATVVPFHRADDSSERLSGANAA